jgi:hypothetical protein
MSDSDPRKVLDRLRQRLVRTYKDLKGRLAEIDDLDEIVDGLRKERDDLERRIRVIEEEFGLEPPESAKPARKRSKVAASKGKALSAAEAIDRTLNGAVDPLTAAEIQKLIHALPGLQGVETVEAVRTMLSRHAAAKGWEKLRGRPARWRKATPGGAP